MRKTLSVILSVIMVLSVFAAAIPVSAAPEGTAINNAEEFMNMAAEGNYYLNSDITLAGSYPNAFKGTFDGNGHTLTVTAPVFLDFSGEVKNLTINGEIVFADQDAAGFAVNSTEGFNATNVTNNANITVTGKGLIAGGIVANILELQDPCTFVNCVNNGNISVETDGTANDGKARVGGMGGIINSVVLYNCVNNGNLEAKGMLPIAAGMVARPALKTGVARAEAYNCVNNGKVTTVGTHVKVSDDGTTAYHTSGDNAAGIFGYIGGSGNSAWYKVWGCQNNGDITGGYEVGGLISYAYASGTAWVDIQFSVNTGNLTYGRTNDNNDASSLWDYCSPFISYTNSTYTTIKYCIDTGSITRRDGALSDTPNGIFVGCSSADSSQYDVQHIYVLNKSQYEFFSWASAESNVAQRRPITEKENEIIQVTLEDITSGKVAALCNAAADQAIKDEDFDPAYMQDDAPANVGNFYAFYQKLGADGDQYPVGREVAIEGKFVLLDGETAKNGNQPEDYCQTTEEEDETTKAPEVDETTKAPEVDETTKAPEVNETTKAPEGNETTGATQEPSGCGSMIAGTAVIIAILGTALVIKKRD